MVRRAATGGKRVPESLALQSDEEEEEEAANSDYVQMDSDDSDYGGPAKKKKKAAPAKKGKRGRPAKKGKVGRPKGPRGKISPSKTPASKMKNKYGYQEPSRASSRAKFRSYAEDSDEEQEDEEDDYFEEDYYEGRARGGGGGAGKRKRQYEEYEDDDEDDYEEEEDEYYRKPTKSRTPIKGKRGPGRPPVRPSLSAKKKLKVPAAKEVFPPVSEMVIESIKALKDPPRKGSTLGSIKETIALNWPVNMVKYDSKIKKFVTRAVESGELIQVKGKGFRGRFTIPGLKIRKKKRKETLSKKFDEDETLYEPKKTARDEAREKNIEEIERKREERRLEEERKADERANKPKRKIVKRTEWEVEAIKGRKEVNGELFYLVKFKGWSKNYWEPEENVAGCDDLIFAYEQEEAVKAKIEEQRKKEQAEGNYEVRKILDVKIAKDKSRSFLIRWVGWGPEGDTWEPEAHLECQDLIDKFMSEWESVAMVEAKRLREAPKKIERLEFAAPGSRASKRNNGIRVMYNNMDEGRYDFL